ncbi:reticulon-2-like [Solea senegalensis]|uniref:Reticulon n=1 Tax=Solea senegalensis TaxID=28829 RepID=A0AAV6PI33_SOLSE|nr:reticulon-2-like [Solea senegalensis]
MASKLVDLVYWRSMWWTGVVFTGLVIGLASLFQLSVITVLSHVFLGLMCVTFPLRLYYKLLELLRWNPGVHPFQSCLDYDSTLTDTDTVMLVEEVVLLMAFAVTEFKRLVFIDNIFDSIKFVVLLYLLSYIGVLINGLTLIIIAVIAVFSLPLLYKKQQVRWCTLQIYHHNKLHAYSLPERGPVDDDVFSNRDALNSPKSLFIFVTGANKEDSQNNQRVCEENPKHVPQSVSFSATLCCSRLKTCSFTCRQTENQVKVTHFCHTLNTASIWD